MLSLFDAFDDEHRVFPCSRDDIQDLILDVDYTRRFPTAAQFNFALVRKGVVTGGICYGQPASPPACVGMMGPEHRDLVLELQRLVLRENERNLASWFVSRTLKMLPPKGIVSWSDTAQGHTGYIYQACNFLYTGASKPRTDLKSASGGHSRHYLKGETERVMRSSKHRYVTFTGTKRDKERMKKLLKWPVMPYPKQV